jgi:hypothetical protein
MASDGESSRQLAARVAGFAVLLYMAVGFASVALHSEATNGEGTDAILRSVAQHRSSLQMTVVLELLECFSALVLAVTLYAITRDESRDLAMMGLACRVGEGVLGATGIRTTLGLLGLTKGGGVTSAAAARTTDALGAVLLMPGQGGMVGAPFFAVGSMAFAYLLLRGRVVPVPLARLGVAASAVLVVGLPLQLAGYLEGPITLYLWLPMVAYQIPLGLWLLVKGVVPMAPLHTGSSRCDLR